MHLFRRCFFIHAHVTNEMVSNINLPGNKLLIREILNNMVIYRKYEPGRLVMRNRTHINILLVGLLTFSLSACGGGGSDPLGINPSTPAAQSDAVGTSNRVLWGMWHCFMEPGTGQIQVVPLRGAMFTANVNNLLEGQSGNLLIEDMDVTDFLTEGRLDCTITLSHPLPGLDQFNGFDVLGIFMHNGNGSLDYDGLTYPADPETGENVAVLLNPDGWTRWFNYTEFNGSGMPILEYYPGKLSNLSDPSATLNPYRIFADGLGEEDDYYDWITMSGNADNRGIFRAGMVNSRRYELDFPIIGGAPVVNFQYAVIATWEPGDPELTGDPLTYDPFDFPTSANCEEPYFLSVSTIGSDLYNDGSGGFGGSFRADIEVFDWQGGSVGGNGVPNEVESIIVEGDFVPGGSYEFSQAELAMLAYPGTENSSIFQVEITNCTPEASGVADLWLIVESAGLNGSSYDQGFPTEFPDGARRASFLPGTVNVGSESPLDVIYVDDSNTSGIEDGTQTNPFNTIQEGVDAAALLVDFEVWVDDSGNAYEEQVNMVSDAVLRSVNWDESDGSNRAFIDGPDVEVSYSVHFYDVDNAVLDGFRIGFAYIGDLGYPYWDTTQMLRIDGGSNITVKDCLFTGLTNMATVYPIAAFNSANLTIANCRMASMDWDTNNNGCTNVWGVYAESCPGLVLNNNVFADIRSNPGGSHSEINVWHVTGSANVVVKNNLIYHITPPAPDMANCMKGIYLKTCTDPEVANNTVDNVDTSDAFFINQCFAYWFDGCHGVGFTNNIATHLYSSGFPQPLARGVGAYNGDAVICDFTDIWDIGPGSYGANYHGDASPGIGAISADPLYIDPDNEQYDISDVSPARWGDPSFVDWDDTGVPSNDPDDYDTNTRSRMGCHGGPGGEFVGLLTPE